MRNRQHTDPRMAAAAAVALVMCRVNDWTEALTGPTGEPALSEANGPALSEANGTPVPRPAWHARYLLSGFAALLLCAATSLPARAQSVTFAGLETTVGTGLSVPQGVAVDGKGDVFIADSDSAALIEVPAGCASSSCQATVASGLGNPFGVTVDGTGDVFVVDNFSRQVVEVPVSCLPPNAACQNTVVSGLTTPKGWRWMKRAISSSRMMVTRLSPPRWWKYR